MRLKVLICLPFALAALGACGPPVCRPGSCPAAEHCLYAPGETVPQCRRACDASTDAGTCAAGTSCQCAATCAGCENCLTVCR